MSFFCSAGDRWNRTTCYEPTCVNFQCGKSSFELESQVEDCGIAGCSGGTCLSCTPTSNRICRTDPGFGNEIWTVNSCDQPQSRIEKCSDNNYVEPWSNPYCLGGNVWQSRQEFTYSCAGGDQDCQENEQTFTQRIETCSNGCSNGECNPTCTNECSQGETGCSADFVNRWTCGEAGDGDACLEKVFTQCTGGRCDATSNQCVAGCTANINCEDNNVCTSNICNVQTGVCSYPATREGLSCQGTGTCRSGQCDLPCADGDDDGWCDEIDQCQNTPAGESVANSGETLGCSCSQLNCADTNECTQNNCNAGVCSNPFEPVGTPCDGGVCNGQGLCEPSPSLTDFDGDGYFAEVDDCDDRNDAIHPGADEVCDGGVNNDCDASTSEEGLVQSSDSSCSKASNGQCFMGVMMQSCRDGQFLDDYCDADDQIPTYFPDEDGDGYGAGLPTCIAAEGYVANDDDCDDSLVSRYAGALEVCDGVDNDCDDQVDEDCEGFFCSESQRECSEEPVREDDFWVLDFCTETRWTNQTIFLPQECAVDCVFVEESVTTETDDTRDARNGTACGSDLLCYEGRCENPCPVSDTIPGCLDPDDADEFFIEVDQPCVTGVCYKCPDHLIWDGEECVNRGYYIDVDSDFTLTKGERVTINPVLREDESDDVESALFIYSGLIEERSSAGVVIDGTSIGREAVIITALKASVLGEPVATKTVTITTVCDASEQCCREGDDTFTEGLSCTNAFGTGLCRSDGTCDVDVPRTFENSYEACHDGLDNDFNGLVDCQVGRDGLVQENCRPYCQAACPAPLVACSNQCIDLEASHDHCGACNNNCGRQEECIGGSCVFQGDDCFVACSRDSQCGATEECVNPGTCEASCQRTNLLVLEEEEQQELLSDIISFRAHTIETLIDGEEVSFTIKNLILTPLTNYVLTISHPEEPTFSTDYPYDRLHSDVIRFKFETIDTEQTVTLRYEEPVAFPATSYTAFGEYETVDVTEAKVLNQQELAIIPSFEEVDGQTVAKLTLNPGSRLTDVRIPLEIPKCLARSMTEIEFKQDNYDVVWDDPLMVWTFDTLNAEEEISFTIPKTVDQDCKDQLRAFGLADETRDPVNPWMPLAIIPLIGVVLVFFQRFHDAGAERHLSKKEFYKLGREQGHEEADLERAWHDYKRRF